VRIGVPFAALFTSLVGCAAILGFEDTTLKPDAIDGSAPLDGGEPDGGTAGEAGGDAGTARLQTDPASVVIRRGSTADVVVSVARGADVVGPVAVTMSDLPAGVTAAPATIADAETTTKLTLTAAADAPFGFSTAHLSVDKGGLPPIEIGILVAGATGAADVTFDGDGYVLDATKGVGSVFNALAVQADGKIVAGGAGTGGWLLRRFNADGSADAAFTTAIGALPTNGEIDGIALDPGSQKIVVVGSSSAGIGQAQLTVVRFDATGAPDATFASGSYRLGGTDSPISSIGLGARVAADGSVVVVGTRKEIAATGDSGIVLRLKSDGQRDAAFAGGKLITVPTTRFVGVAFDAAGAVVIGGTDSTTAPGSYTLAKRTATGDVDTTFGKNGVTAFGLGFRAQGFARLGDGSLVLVGDSAQGGNVYTAGRTDAMGTEVFVRGVVTGNNASFFGVAGDAMNRILACGHTPGGTGEARVERLLADGQVDAMFGSGGGTLVNATTLFAAAVEPDGRIVVAGNRMNQGAVVVRLWP